jgi:peptidoglycan/LPS O-acetylase OafA/YrhL
MAARSSSRVGWWKATAILGALLILSGIVSAYVEVATRHRFDSFSHNPYVFLPAMLIGVILTFVGLIAWARLIERAARVRMAVWVFISPLIVSLLGHPITDHGPAVLVLMLILPAALLSVVLLGMAGLMGSPGA